MAKLIKIFLFFSFYSFAVWADGLYHKNSLIGGRASGMGGAYKAISDDASGAFYNPAGLVYSDGDSISGSANSYVSTKSTYKETIGNRDWERETDNLLPNFFGATKKFGKYTFGFSYVITDYMKENQNQVFQNLDELADPIDLFAFNLQSEDATYLIGPSLAMELSENLTFGVSLFYHRRVFRRSQSQLIQFGDGSDYSSYQNLSKRERGFHLRTGLLYSLEKHAFALTLSKAVMQTAIADSQANTKERNSSATDFGRRADVDRPKYPYEIGLGYAYFASPYLLVSADFDYYLHSEENRRNMWNAAVGAEYFLNSTYALRTGFYTNNTNSRKPSEIADEIPVEYMNMYGLTAGIGIHSKSSTISLGVNYGFGSGDARIYSSENSASTETKRFERQILGFLIAADYGF